jgi:hypothetical protein
MTYSLAIVIDPEAFDASFYGAGAPESFFTEHYDKARSSSKP